MKIEKNLEVQKGNAWPLGVSKTERGMNFAIAVDLREPFILKITTAAQIYEIPMHEYHVIGDVFAVTVRLRESYFEYEYIAGSIRLRDNYARGLASASVWGEARPEKTYCYWNKKFDWKEDRPLEIPCHDLVMYKLHVRGFTQHPTSKVRHPGTFLGVAEKAGYLKSLGVNCVELMPAAEFDEMTAENENLYVIPGKQPEAYKMNYWGYGRAFYFAPKAAYAAGPNPQEEFKKMVRTLHEAGIEVVMEFSFEEDTNKNLITDCLRYWAEEYHVDGFHISSACVPLDLIVTDPVLARVKLFGEYFNIDDSKNIHLPAGYKHLAVYHDEYEVCCRRFLKGDGNMTEYFSNLLRANGRSVSFVRYLANHNGMRLWDMVTYDEKHNEANKENNKDGTDYNYSWNCGTEGETKRRKVLDLRKQQIRNAWMFILINQGIPLIYAGDEFGHTQQGNNNPYCQDNEISWIDWSKMRKNRAMLDMVRRLIVFRKSHPMMHMEKPLRMMDYLSCGYPDFSMHGTLPWKPELSEKSRFMGTMYCGKYAHFEGAEDDFIYVAYNMHWESKEVHLPILPKTLSWVCEEDTAGRMVTGEFVTSCEMAPRSVAVFVSRTRIEHEQPES